MATEKARTRRINIRLSDALADQLDELSEKMGLAPATLAATALSEYLYQKKLQSDNQKQAMALTVRQVSKAITDQFSNPEFIAQLMDQGIEPDLEAIEAEKQRNLLDT